MMAIAPRHVSNSRDCRNPASSDSSRPHLKSKPDLKELLEEQESISSWQTLLINLGVKKERINEFESKHPGNVALQKGEALEYWLRETADACWLDIINALFDMEENVLARELKRKYDWKDPRVPVKRTLYCVPKSVMVHTEHISGTSHNCFTLETSTQPPPTKGSVARNASFFCGIIQKNKPDNLTDFLKKIELSDYKDDFRVGLEARFGKLHWDNFNKVESDSKLGLEFSIDDWKKSKVTPGLHSEFNPEVHERDLNLLLKDRKCIGEEETKLTIQFTVKGEEEGTYRAVVGLNDPGTFHLIAVYQQSSASHGGRARINIVLPGRKYDFRIADCSEYTLKEHEKSRPLLIAREITATMQRCSRKKLSLILRGETEDKGSSWEVKYLRQRVQKQYEWRPDKRWILVAYDVDVFDSETNQTVCVTEAPLNELVLIPDFDSSKKEVELWKEKIFPKDVSQTSTLEVEASESHGGVWTADSLMSDFEEFLEAAFTVAHILDGSPPY